MNQTLPYIKSLLIKVLMMVLNYLENHNSSLLYKRTCVIWQGPSSLIFGAGLYGNGGTIFHYLFTIRFKKHKSIEEITKRNKIFYCLYFLSCSG